MEYRIIYTYTFRVTIFLTLLLSPVFAQTIQLDRGIEAVTPETYNQEETYINNNDRTRFFSYPLDRLTFLELAQFCAGGIAGTVDSNNDGLYDIRDSLRTYGTYEISEESYRLLGPRVISKGLEIAAMRARDQVNILLNGIKLDGNKVFDSMYSNVEAGAATSNGQASTSTSVAISDELEQYLAEKTDGTLYGGRISGRRIVSYGNSQGLCVTIRYEVPFNQAAASGIERLPLQYPQQQQQQSPPQSPPQSQNNEAEYPIPPPAKDYPYPSLPPGVVGDY